jgi:hypothetical protein
MKSKIGLWIDYKQPFIVDIGTDSEATARTNPESCHTFALAAVLHPNTSHRRRPWRTYHWRGNDRRDDRSPSRG